MIKVGLIGCGNIGSKRILSIIKDKNTRIKYIIGPKKINKSSKCRGLELSKKLKCIYSTDRNKVLNSDVNAIILSTGPTLFKKIGTEILNANKHLLIEKPLGLNESEALYLTKLANKKKLVLKTGFNLRFDEGINKAKEIVFKKKIGKIYFLKITYVNGSVKTNKNKVGALSDIGSHSINLIEYIINKKINIINSMRQSIEHKKDDNGFIILKIHNILCSIHFSFVRWKNKFSLEISGQKGYVKVDSLPKWGKQTLTFGKRIFPSGKPLIKKVHYFKENSWYNEWIHFKKLIKNFDLSNNQEGLSNMRVVNKIKSI